jgi:DNA modification methylase
MTFEDDAERQVFFRARLREYLAEPDFRARDGFPNASDDAIVEMSDPPYFTACPNPFFGDFVRDFGREYSPEEVYRRSPFVADVAVAKTDHLYKSHRYHTKVPYRAIAQYILHYTSPGDVILDGFCGTGMTGVAAEYVNDPEPELLKVVAEGSDAVVASGPRPTLLVDLSPAAAALASGFNATVDIHSFAEWAESLMAELNAEIGWVYRCDHEDQKSVGLVTEYVWSEIFLCPSCQGEVNFFEQAFDENFEALDVIECTHCGSEVSKRTLEKLIENVMDDRIGEQVQRPVRRLVRVHYKVGRSSYVRAPLQSDLDRIAKSDLILPSASLPVMPIPYMHMTHERARMDRQGITHYHHFFMPRIQVALSRLWSAVHEAVEPEKQKLGRFWVDSHFMNLSIQNCYRPGVSFPYNPISGIYYVSAVISEPNPFIAYENKLKQIVRGFAGRTVAHSPRFVMTGSCSSIPIPENCIDYVFTDPPFGENIYYSDLNFLVEAWLDVITDANREAIVDRAREKDLADYEEAMRACFAEYFRVLKPGRWMTVVFSNSKAAVWNAIQVALQQAGFVVAEVTALDKTQGSYRQVTSPNAVKQDLVVSCYKPNGGLEDRFQQRGVTEDTAWDFIRTHLKNLAVVKRTRAGGVDSVAERDARRLFDRMVAWFVRHNTPVPLSSAEFQAGLAERFPERDSMFFLPNQIDEYDKARMQAGDPPQRDLFVDDERTAIDWLTDFLKAKPSTYQEVHPDFTQKTGAGWRKHETKPELLRLLDENFLKFDGNGPVPSQIHAYLSSNWKELRNLDKDDPQLVEKARNRWFVPDPNKQQDVEARRDKALLREFDIYKAHKGKKMKEIRLEVMRVGFKAAWAAKDYRTIIDVSAKVPDEVWQEDERLMMLHSMAETRLEAER